MKLLEQHSIDSLPIMTALAGCRGQLYATRTFPNYCIALVIEATDELPSRLYMFSSLDHEEWFEKIAQMTNELPPATKFSAGLIPNYAAESVLKGSYAAEDIGLISSIPEENRFLSDGLKNLTAIIQEFGAFVESEE